MSPLVVAAGLTVGVAAPAAGQTRLTKPNIVKPTVVASGRYRVLLTGFGVSKETADDPRGYDGKMDEVFGASAVVLWDRRNGQILSQPTVVRTVTYGEIGPSFRGRIRAGSAGPQGGLWGGNGAEYAPMEFDPRGAALPPPNSAQFPLLIFEGGLSDGAEALLVAPSLWEVDGDPTAFGNYDANWRTGGVARFLNSPMVVTQLTNPALTSAVMPDDPGLQIASALTTAFTGGVIGSYGFYGVYTQSRIDRPIGLFPAQQAAHYQDRLVVITREKLASLAVGGGITLAVPFWEPYDNFLNGVYTGYVRVERIQ